MRARIISGLHTPYDGVEAGDLKQEVCGSDHPLPEVDQSFSSQLSKLVREGRVKSTTVGGWTRYWYVPDRIKQLQEKVAKKERFRRVSEHRIDEAAAAIKQAQRDILSTDREIERLQAEITDLTE